MRLALARFLNGSNNLILRSGSLTTDLEWVLPGAVPTTNQVLGVAAIASNIVTLGWLTQSGGGGGGTVTSVGFTAPTEFAVSGSPITASGTLGIAWATQSPNQVLASPVSGGNGVPTFRTLVAADIPVLDASKISTGMLAIALLPTGTTSGTVALGNDSRLHAQNTDTGTNAQSFQLNNGATGIRLKDNAGVLEVRNAADSALANLVVANLTVSGTTTTINSETVAIADNIITLNSDFITGTPTENAGIEVRRGTSTNSSLIWDESTDIWKAGIVGSEVAIARKVSRTFVAADLSGGVLTWTHNLGTLDLVWKVYDNLNNSVFPEVVTTSTNIITLNFLLATIAGTWRAIVVG